MLKGSQVSVQIPNEDATRALAAQLAPCLKAGDALVLEGDLGAGKTHFVQGVASALGVAEDIMSPTYNILLTYPQGRLPLYHFDVYRLEEYEELDDIGFYEVIESDGVTFIEWGNKFPDALPYGYVEVRILANADGSRTFCLMAKGNRAEELLGDWAQAAGFASADEAAE